MEIWGPGNPEIWRFGELEIQKFGVQQIKQIKNLKIQIRSAQNVGKVWISRKKSSRPYLGPSEAIFSIDRKNQKNIVFCLFSLVGQWAPRCGPLLLSTRGGATGISTVTCSGKSPSSPNANLFVALTTAASNNCASDVSIQFYIANHGDFFCHKHPKLGKRFVFFIKSWVIFWDP